MGRLVWYGFGWALAAAKVAAGATIPVTTTIDAVRADGACSLREAVRAAARNQAVDTCAPGDTGEDTIVLPAGSFSLSVRGVGENEAARGDLDLDGITTLVGAGPANTVIEGAALGDRLLHVQSGARVVIIGVALEGGGTDGLDGGAMLLGAGGNTRLEQVHLRGNLADAGGAIAASGGLLELIGCTVDGNEARTGGGGLSTDGATVMLVGSTLEGNTAGGAGGGARVSGGTLTIAASTVRTNSAGSNGGGLALVAATSILQNATVSGNDAEGDGGGLWVSAGAATLANVTIARNTADADGGGNGAGGGLHSTGGAAVAWRNSLVARNFDDGSGPDCAGPVTSEGYTLVQTPAGCGVTIAAGDLLGANADLLVLAQNGGPTRTHALGPASAGRDAGNPAMPGSGPGSCEPADQRGAARPAGGRCDMGAVEEGGVVPSTTTTTTTDPGQTTTSVLGSSTTVTVASTTTTTVTLPPQGLCPAGAEIISPAVVVQGLGGRRGNERLIVSGRVPLGLGAFPTLDPSVTGMQVLLEDLGGAATRYYDLSVVSHPIRPGAPRRQCGGKDGWRRFRYRNRSGTLDFPVCTKGSALGLRSVVVRDERATGRGLSFSLVARRTRLAGPVGPLRLTVAFDATVDAFIAGQCAQHTFLRRSCLSGGDRYACR